MPLLTWQLWLAREIVIDDPQPKAKVNSQQIDALVELRESLGGVLAAIGTPSHSPKPRGKSPGWPEGQTRKRRIPYPTVKKGITKQKQQQPKSA